MNIKTIGAGFVIVGTVFLISYPLYILFKEGEVPLFIKTGIALIIIGVGFILPKMIAEAKKDKVKIN